ncbi:putative methyltransferase-domain-containing protein [Irpex rosettiformis]|uniref:Methyltransferase-domain-containing protein n=1 Tax=Irpex rosettiformis TaxID=378272 RepID=A0ACB8UE97_9APHY|nr:putative methyltransferase-domain-containing protein [Irpex rosettiformis]
MLSISEPLQADLALEETLDALDPLRHLRDDSERDVVPVQPPSVHNQTLELTFPPPSSLNADNVDKVLIRLLVDASPGCGGIAWPAGEVLSSFITRQPSLKAKNVLELGSGTGLVGLVAAKLGADVWITDQQPLLEIMSRNVAMNDLGDRVKVLELNWGGPLPEDLPRFDLILAADCVYFEPAFPLLVQTLDDLSRRDDSEILFCYKKRRKADKRFFTMLKKRFSWEEVNDDPDKPNYSRDAISLLRLFHK